MIGSRRTVVGVVVVVAVLGALACSSPPSSTPSTTAAARPADGSATPSTSSSTDTSRSIGSIGSAPPGSDVPDPANGRNPTLGIGDDESFPNLGSSGYDVRHYGLDLDYDPDSNDLDATATIDARANTELAEVSFDFDGLDVTKVSVDGKDADFTVKDRKLEITTPARLDKGATFTVIVDYGGRPKPRATDAVFGVEVGWHGGGGGSVVVSEPEGASTWYPVNNHPRDKATYTFAITVPEPYSAIANGRLENTEAHEGTRTFHWVMDKPMANYLSSVVTGEFEEHVRGESDGVVFSDWLPVDGRQPGDISGQTEVELLSDKLGPFPFATYGAVVYPASFVHGSSGTQDFLGNVALETQGRSLYSENAVTRSTVMHETAHQWMGNNVSLTDWSKDIWWIEGFAHFAETAFDDSTSRREWELTRAGCEGKTPGDLDKRALFGEGSYVCGSLVFYALQQEVGDETFWKILRTFNERFRYSNATTEDLIATASDVAGKDLSDFMHAWLFGPLPALP